MKYSAKALWDEFSEMHAMDYNSQSQTRASKGLSLCKETQAFTLEAAGWSHVTASRK